MGIYKYSLHWFDDGNNYELVEAKGLIVAENFREVMDKINTYYKDDNLNDVSIEMLAWDELGLFELSIHKELQKLADYINEKK